MNMNLREGVTCHACNKGISSATNLIVVGQLYPHFPIARYHDGCYAKFLKSGRFWVGPRGPVVYNGAKQGRSAVMMTLFLLAWFAILVFAVRPSMPERLFSDIIYYALLAVGVFGALEFVVVRMYARRLGKYLRR